MSFFVLSMFVYNILFCFKWIYINIKTSNVSLTWNRMTNIPNSIIKCEWNGIINCDKNESETQSSFSVNSLERLSTYTSGTTFGCFCRVWLFHTCPYSFNNLMWNCTCMYDTPSWKKRYSVYHVEVKEYISYTG